MKSWRKYKMSTKKSDGLSAKELKELKEKIEAEKQKIGFFDKEEVFREGQDNTDEVDMASADYTQSQILRMRNREIFYFKKLERALKKIEDGEYGICEDCNAPIKYQRLAARPTAELCIDCKEEAERDELSNVLSKQSKSLGEVMKMSPTSAPSNNAMM